MYRFTIVLIAIVLSGMVPGQAHTKEAYETVSLPSLDQWNPYPENFKVGAVQTEYGPGVFMDVPDGTPDDWSQISFSYEAAPGDRAIFRVKATGEALENGHGLIATIGFYDKDNNRISHNDMYAHPYPEGWIDFICRAAAPEGTVDLRVILILNGKGKAWFVQPELEFKHATTPPALGDTPLTLRVTDEVVTERIVGFGAEDDGWFYNEHNREHGADEAAYALREDRIRWLDPDWMRMFFWYTDFNASLDAENYTWDSDNMLSHYRTLDLYQEMGVRVTICGVEWAVPGVFENPEQQSKAIGDLLEHLIREKGYSCIRDWTFTNEPNLFYWPQTKDFPRYVKFHQLVAQEIERRGLDVNVVGSDDGEGLGWFDSCVKNETYASLVGLWASHNYYDRHAMDFSYTFVKDRIDRLRAKQHPAPFVLAEFGFKDERTVPPATNPLMSEYDYALFTQRVVSEGVNLGLAGASMWCLHQAMYPGATEPMGFGLWNWADKDWTVRPAYHGMGVFMRLTESDEAVHKVDVNPEYPVRGACIGDTFFWVHWGETPMKVQVENFEAESNWMMTEGDLTHDRDCSKRMDLEDPTQFTAPPRSFGYLLRGAEHTAAIDE